MDIKSCKSIAGLGVCVTLSVYTEFEKVTVLWVVLDVFLE